MKTITNLVEANAVLEPFWPTNMFRYAYTLEHIERFMDYAGNPQNAVPAIHIAGTSGKTSTAYYAAALLMQAGKKVGMITSPHIEGLNDRVQVNLQPLPEKEFCAELTIFMELIEKSGIHLTFAEILYGFGYWELVRQRVDYIVVEVGLGGLLDATNVITRSDKICAITDIGLDHTHVLGDTLPKIAAQKAGIIHLGNAVFCHSQSEEVIRVFKDTCRQKQADLHIIDRDPVVPDFLPLFQKRNFSLALEAITFALSRESHPQLTPAQTVQAAKTHIPGRMEIITKGSKTLILDSAHNPQKLQALCQSLQAQFGKEKIAMMVAFMESPGRDITDMIAELKPVATHLIFTHLPPTMKRHTGRSPQEVARIAQKSGIASYEVQAGWQEAYRKLLGRPEKVLVITGSTYLLEPIRPIVLGRASV